MTTGNNYISIISFLDLAATHEETTAARDNLRQFMKEAAGTASETPEHGWGGARFGESKEVSATAYFSGPVPRKVVRAVEVLANADNISGYRVRGHVEPEGSQD